MRWTYDAAVRHILSYVNWEAVRDRRPMAGGRGDLARFRRALARLGHPECVAPAVHVGGTNGKGSTGAMVRALLSAHGYRTGLYTSPHLVTMRERVQVDGRPIGRADFARATREAAGVIDGPAAAGFRTTFELLTALAFLAFRDAAVTAQVIEVGLGGRLDATNVLDPRVVVMTAISLDHTEVLGDTPAAIAADKAGIFRRGRPVVSAAQTAGAARTLAARARRVGAPIEVFGRELRASSPEPTARGERFDLTTPRAGYPGLVVALRGAHQVENAALAVAAVEHFMGEPLDPVATRAALAGVRWPGRFQYLARRPVELVDGAHNPAGAARLAETLGRYHPGRRVVFVLGVSEGKNVDELLEALAPAAHAFVTVAANHPRAADSRRLAARAAALTRKPADWARGLPEARRAARRLAGTDGVVCIAGSLYLVGEALSAGRA